MTPTSAPSSLAWTHPTWRLRRVLEKAQTLASSQDTFKR